MNFIPTPHLPARFLDVSLRLAVTWLDVSGPLYFESTFPDKSSAVGVALDTEVFWRSASRIHSGNCLRIVFMLI